MLAIPIVNGGVVTGWHTHGNGWRDMSIEGNLRAIDLHHFAGVFGGWIGRCCLGDQGAWSIAAAGRQIELVADASARLARADIPGNKRLHGGVIVPGSPELLSEPIRGDFVGGQQVHVVSPWME